MLDILSDMENVVKKLRLKGMRNCVIQLMPVGTDKYAASNLESDFEKRQRVLLEDLSHAIKYQTTGISRKHLFIFN